MKIAVLSFCTFLSWFSLAQNTSIPVVNNVRAEILNYGDKGQVQLLKKLELGVMVSDNISKQINNFLKKVETDEADKLNPYLEWDIDLEFTFTHKESGASENIDAFYYVEFERNLRKNDWVELPNKYPFRVRFAPTKEGDWSYSAVLKVRGKNVASIPENSFTVVDNEAHGFTMLHPNGRNVQLDGNIIIPVGHNFISPVNGVDTYACKPGETNKAARVDDWLDYHKDIQAYHRLGGRYFRFVCTAWSSMIEFEEKGNYYGRMHYAWEQDRLLEYCEANNMLINMNFMFQEPLMNYGQYNTAAWDFSHYEVQSDNSYRYNANDQYKPFCYNDSIGKEPHQMFTDEDDLRYHEQRMRYYISRYGYSTSIMMFEFLSESWHLDQYYPGPSFEMLADEHGEKVRNALKTYNERMAAYIKDSLNHKQHLIGLHAFDNKIFWEDTVAQKILDPSAKLSGIDVVGFSTYKNEPQRLLIKKTNRGSAVDEGENSFYQKNTEFWSDYGKPIMHFEQGSSSDRIGANDASNYTPHSVDVRTVGFTGCAGFFAWEGFIKTEGRDQSVAWSSTVLGEKWMNNEFNIGVLSNSNGTWIQGRQAERHTRKVSRATKETEYYVSGDKKSATGYVLNRTFNSFTMSTTEENKALQTNPGDAYDELTSIAWDEGRKLLYVSELLPKQAYKITWYDWTTFEEIGTQVLKTSKRGEYRLEFPELTLIPGNLMRPMVWFTLTIAE